MASPFCLGRAVFICMHHAGRLTGVLSLSPFCTNGSWSRLWFRVCEGSGGLCVSYMCHIWYPLGLKSHHQAGKSATVSFGERWEWDREGRFIYFHPLRHQNLDSSGPEGLSPKNFLQQHWSSCFTWELYETIGQERLKAHYAFNSTYILLYNQYATKL